MATGTVKWFRTVKWFSSEKGYGFIAPEDGSKDVFVHCTGIDGTGHRSLEQGDHVEFEITGTQKGLAATGVRRIAPQTQVKIR